MGTAIGRIVSLENPWKNLFDLKTQKHIWAGLSNDSSVFLE